MVNYLRWLWRGNRCVARVLVVGVAILLACAPGFALSEIAALSTVRVVHAQSPAVVHLGAGTYDISQDLGDRDFPDDSTELSIIGPGRPALVRTGAAGPGDRRSGRSIPGRVGLHPGHAVHDPSGRSLP